MLVGKASTSKIYYVLEPRFIVGHDVRNAWNPNLVTRDTNKK